jgi:hypothetical protein
VILDEKCDKFPAFCCFANCSYNRFIGFDLKSFNLRKGGRTL